MGRLHADRVRSDLDQVSHRICSVLVKRTVSLSHALRLRLRNSFSTVA